MGVLRLIPIAILLMGASLGIRAQYASYGRSVIDSLCRKNLHGRGYINNGDDVAAHFIAREFSRIGLHKVQLQSFQLDVNTFPEQQILELNGESLKPALQFLADPSSPPVSGEFGICFLHPPDFRNGELTKKIKKAKDCFIAVSQSEFDSMQTHADSIAGEGLKSLRNALLWSEDPLYKNTPGILEFTTSPLSWWCSPTQANRARILIESDAFTRTDQENPALATINIHSKLLKGHTSNNVIASLGGTSNSGQCIIIGAHYDHLGQFDSAVFTGANDNASGTAMLLSLAKFFADTLNRLPFDMVFIAFAGEETGLDGSTFFCNDLPFPTDSVRFMLNLDMVGTGSEGIQVVNGKQFPVLFERLQQLNTQNSFLPQVKIRGERCNSDHCCFYELGIPSFFIYTLGGPRWYHDVFDTPENLTLTAFNSLADLIILFLKSL